MASMADTLEEALLDHFFIDQASLTIPASLNLHLYTTEPNEDGTGGVEVTGNNYAATAVNLSSGIWSRTDNVITNTATLSSGTSASGGDWGPITAFALKDGSDFWFIEALTSPITVTSGNAFQFGAGALEFTGGGAFTTWAWGQILEWMFRGGSLTFPTTLDWQLTSTAPTAAAAGTVLSGNGYADLAVDLDTDAWLRTDSRIANKAIMEWPTATPSDWLDVEGVQALDGSANRWLWVDLASARSVPAGTQPRFVADALGFTAA